uniref:Uncharacterized protein n=1 Tax=Acrobeloides nanus TaxID=290746 RepID=A0A914E5V0_9BILA
MSLLFILYLVMSFGLNFSQPYYCTYMIAMWRSYNAYNAYWVYWTIAFNLPFVSTMQIVLFFMTVERCLTMHFPVLYSKSHQKMILFVCLICLVVVAIICQYAYYLDYPKSGFIACRSVGCLMINYGELFAILKPCFACINIAIGSYFFFLLRKYNNPTGESSGESKKKKISDFVVKYTLFIEFVFNFTPLIIELIVRLTPKIVPKKDNFMSSQIS